MHGLIFETSVWLLAGSTRLISLIVLFLWQANTRVQTTFLFYKSKSRMLFSIRKIYAALCVLRYHFWFLKTYMQNKFSSQKIVILEFAMLNKLAATNDVKLFTMKFFVVLIWLYSQHRKDRHKHIGAIRTSHKNGTIT
jgi:hypothetical protein